MTIGENIKKYRIEKGLTQKELAERCNLSRSYLADIERNRYNPSLETLKIIAKNLDISLSTLLGENGKGNDLSELEKEFPDGVYILRRANKELSQEAKKQMIKIMKAFLEEDKEDD